MIKLIDLLREIKVNNPVKPFTFKIDNNFGDGEYWGDLFDINKEMVGGNTRMYKGNSHNPDAIMVSTSEMRARGFEKYLENISSNISDLPLKYVRIEGELKEIKINKPGKIQAVPQPQYEPDNGGVIYKLDLHREDIVGVGEYFKEKNIIEFYISTWGKGLELINIFKKRKIDYHINKNPYDDGKYVWVIIKNADKYFEFLK